MRRLKITDARPRGQAPAQREMSLMGPTSLPLYSRNAGRDGPPLVFIHGIKGSSLVASNGAVHWLTAAAALGLHTPDLRLPLRWNGERQDADDLIATEPIASVDIARGLVRSQVYGPWLERAEALGRPFYAFAYDWRRDNLESRERFRACVAAVRERHGGSRVQLVAHSMGGLISLPVLIEHPEWFCHALFAGVPFRGAISFLEDMHVGLPTGVNRKLLSPGVLFTCPSTYALYPLGRSDCVDGSGRELQIDFFDASHWVEHGIGIFADPRNATAERIAFLGRALERARGLRALLEHREQAYPRITVLAGKSFPTLAVAMKGGPRSVRGWDLRSWPRRPGDSRVSFDNVAPPEGFDYEVVVTSLPHAAMLNDPALPDVLRAGASSAATGD